MTLYAGYPSIWHQFSIIPIILYHHIYMYFPLFLPTYLHLLVLPTPLPTPMYHIDIKLINGVWCRCVGKFVKIYVRTCTRRGDII